MPRARLRTDQKARGKKAPHRQEVRTSYLPYLSYHSSFLSFCTFGTFLPSFASAPLRKERPPAATVAFSTHGRHRAVEGVWERCPPSASFPKFFNCAMTSVRSPGGSRHQSDRKLGIHASFHCHLTPLHSFVTRFLPLLEQALCRRKLLLLSPPPSPRTAKWRQTSWQL